MKSSPRDLAIALAGIFQAVRLVQQIAPGEQRDERALAACLSGLFNTDPESVDTVFGNLAGLQLGLEIVRDQVAGPNAKRRGQRIGYHESVGWQVDRFELCIQDAAQLRDYDRKVMEIIHVDDFDPAELAAGTETGTGTKAPPTAQVA